MKKSVVKDEGQRFCTQCQTQKETANGVWVLMNKGRQRRWRCVECARVSGSKPNKKKTT